MYIDKQGSSKKFTVGVYDPDTHTVTDIREITIDDVPEKYQEEVKQTVLDSTIAEKIKEYNELMAMS